MRKETSKIQITAKLLVAAAAIVHLIFTYVHTNACCFWRIKFAGSSCSCLYCWVL